MSHYAVACSFVLLCGWVIENDEPIKQEIGTFKAKFIRGRVSV